MTFILLIYHKTVCPIWRWSTKALGERVTGFLEGMIRNGGRNGIALLFGLRISL